MPFNDFYLLIGTTTIVNKFYYGYINANSFMRLQGIKLEILQNSFKILNFYTLQNYIMYDNEIYFSL